MRNNHENDKSDGEVSSRAEGNQHDVMIGEILWITWYAVKARDKASRDEGLTGLTDIDQTYCRQHPSARGHKARTAQTFLRQLA